MPEFKDNLRFLRKRVGLSQKELGKILNVATSTIGMYEAGKRFPEKDIEEKIADFFNVSLDELRGINSNTEQNIMTLFNPDYCSKSTKEIIESLPRLNDRDLRMIIEIASYLTELNKNED